MRAPSFPELFYSLPAYRANAGPGARAHRHLRRGGALPAAATPAERDLLRERAARRDRARRDGLRGGSAASCPVVNIEGIDTRGLELEAARTFAGSRSVQFAYALAAARSDKATGRAAGRRARPPRPALREPSAPASTSLLSPALTFRGGAAPRRGRRAARARRLHAVRPRRARAQLPPAMELAGTVQNLFDTRLRRTLAAGRPARGLPAARPRGLRQGAVQVLDAVRNQDRAARLLASPRSPRHSRARRGRAPRRPCRFPPDVQIAAAPEDAHLRPLVPVQGASPAVTIGVVYVPDRPRVGEGQGRDAGDPGAASPTARSRTCPSSTWRWSTRTRPRLEKAVRADRVNVFYIAPGNAAGLPALLKMSHDLRHHHRHRRARVRAAGGGHRHRHQGGQEARHPHQPARLAHGGQRVRRQPPAHRHGGEVRSVPPPVHQGEADAHHHGHEPVAVMVACALFIVYDIEDFKRKMAEDLRVVAEGIAINTTPALEFESLDSAREILGALRAYEHIETAVIFDKQGQQRGLPAAPTSAEAPPPGPAPGGRLLRGRARLLHLPQRAPRRRQDAGHHLHPVRHAGARRPARQLRARRGHRGAGLAARRPPPLLAAAEAHLAPHPPPGRHREPGHPGEGLLAARGEGHRRRAGRAHRRLQRDAGADPAARRRAHGGQGGGGAGQPHQERLPGQHEPRAAHAR